jgi:hypothetical protein
METNSKIVLRLSKNMTVPPEIDIADVLQAKKGGEWYVFSYLPGDPAAYAFMMEWFYDEAEQHPLTENVPIVSFNPATPAQTIGVRFQGLVHILVPLLNKSIEYYGRVSICNKDGTKTMAKIEAPISEIEAPHRRHRPTWEIH